MSPDGDKQLVIKTFETLPQRQELGYQPRALVQLTLPHRDPKTNSFVRTNGRLRLELLAPAELGLPYGTYPRLALAFFTTQAVRTKSSKIYLGSSFREFMSALGIPRVTGPRGSVHRLREQLIRLSKTAFYIDWAEEKDGDTSSSGTGLLLIKNRTIWDKNFAQPGASSWENHVELSRDFYEEIVDKPVPIKLEALRELRRSPLALDIYCWLTYRMSYLRSSTRITWSTLAQQFGSNHAETKTFARDFKSALLQVLEVYPDARVRNEPAGLVLRPSSTHVPLSRLQPPSRELRDGSVEN